LIRIKLIPPMFYSICARIKATSHKPVYWMEQRHGAKYKRAETLVLAVIVPEKNVTVAPNNEI